MTTGEAIVILIIFGVPLSVLIGVILRELLHELKVISCLKALKTFIISAFKPLTPLQKEIREEERTIKEIEAQKADMERLAALKRKREALFEEVGESDFKTRTGPHFHWCALCGNYYAGDECACRKKAGDVINPLHFIKGQTIEEAGESHARAMSNLGKKGGHTNDL